jgi:hypothetical protein
VRSKHGVLNLKIARIEDDSAALETIDVKLQQNNKRLRLTLGSLNGLSFFSLAD